MQGGSFTGAADVVGSRVPQRHKVRFPMCPAHSDNERHGGTNSKPAHQAGSGEVGFTRRVVVRSGLPGGSTVPTQAASMVKPIGVEQVRRRFGHRGDQNPSHQVANCRCETGTSEPQPGGLPTVRCRRRIRSTARIDRACGRGHVVAEVRAAVAMPHGTTGGQPRRPARSAKASSAASTSGERHTRFRGPLVVSTRMPASVSGLR